MDRTNSYWKNIFDTASRQFFDAPLRQVGKTVNGREISNQQLQLVITAVIDALQLTKDDSVIDLCCGNGLITKALAPLVGEIIGIDFSSGLIKIAEMQRNFTNIKYIESDVLNLNPGYFFGYKKIFMYEALQHFSESQLGLLLGRMENLAPGSLIFFGSIPDLNKLRSYYDTVEKFDFYLQSERTGNPHIGKWWLMEEIEQTSLSHGFRVQQLHQNPPTLYGLLQI